MSKLPRVGDDIVMSVPQREQVAAHVSGMGAGWLELDLLDSPRTPMSQLERMPLFIEFINDEGVARMHGRLGRDPEERGLLRRGFRESTLVRFAHKGTVQLLQRREFVRATAVLGLTIIPVRGYDHVARRAQTLDIGGGGMLVRGLPAPRAGEEYDFELDLDPGGMPIQGRCRVVRVEGADRAGVQFTALDQRDRTRIIQRAFDLSRFQKRRLA